MAAAGSFAFATFDAMAETRTYDRRESDARYDRSEKGRARCRRYNETDAGRTRKRRWLWKQWEPENWEQWERSDSYTGNPSDFVAWLNEARPLKLPTWAGQVLGR